MCKIRCSFIPSLLLSSIESGRFNEAYSQANLYVVAISKCQIKEIKGLVEFVPSQDCLYHVK